VETHLLRETKNSRLTSLLEKNVRSVILHVVGVIHVEYRSLSSVINTNACWDMVRYVCVCVCACACVRLLAGKVLDNVARCTSQQENATTNRLILTQYLLQSILCKLADNPHYYLGSWINTWNVIDSTWIKKRKWLVIKGCVSTLWVLTRQNI
jgi:uncharacterized membrane protein YeiB